MGGGSSKKRSATQPAAVDMSMYIAIDDSVNAAEDAADARTEAAAKIMRDEETNATTRRGTRRRVTRIPFNVTALMFSVVVDAVEETVAGAEQEQQGKQGQQEQKGKQEQQQQQQLGEQDEELEEQIGTPDPTGADLGDCSICYDSIAEFMPDGCAHRCCKSCLTRNERSDQGRMRKCPFCEHSYSSITNVATLEKSNLLPLPRVHEAPQGTDVQESARVLEEFDHLRLVGVEDASLLWSELIDDLFVQVHAP
jgi:hypothetical protein